MEVLKNSLPTHTAREKKFGFAYLVFDVFFLPSLLVGVNGLVSHPLNGALLNFLYFSINCLATVTIFGRFLKKNFLRFGRFPRETLLYAAAGFGTYWLCNCLLTALLQAVFPNYVNLNDSSVAQMLDTSPVFMIIGTVFLAPIAEELLHRGLVFGVLCEKKPIVAYWVSALFFGMIHVLSYVGTYPAAHLLLALIQYLPAGLVLAWCYRRSGCIFTPILIHIAANAASIILLR